MYNDWIEGVSMEGKHFTLRSHDLGYLVTTGNTELRTVGTVVTLYYGLAVPARYYSSETWYEGGLACGC